MGTQLGGLQWDGWRKIIEDGAHQNVPSEDAGQRFPKTHSSKYEIRWLYLLSKTPFLGLSWLDLEWTFDPSHPISFFLSRT